MVMKFPFDPSMIPYSPSFIQKFVQDKANESGIDQNSIINEIINKSGFYADQVPQNESSGLSQLQGQQNVSMPQPSQTPNLDLSSINQLDSGQNPLLQQLINQQAQEMLAPKPKWQKIVEGIGQMASGFAPLAASLGGGDSTPFLAMLQEKAKLPNERDVRLKNLFELQKLNQPDFGIKEMLALQMGIGKQQSTEDYRKANLALREQANQQAKENQKFLQNIQMDTQTQKLETKLKPLQDISRGMKTVEGYLGFDPETYNKADNTAKFINPQTGKEEIKPVEIGGVTIPGIGWVTALDDKAKQLDNAMQRVMNLEIKDQSGAAVSNQEMDRLKSAWSSGEFNTIPQKLQAFSDYKKAVKKAMKSQQAAFGDETVKLYQSRGGETHDTFYGKSQTKQPMNQPKVDTSGWLKDKNGIPYKVY